MSESLNLLRAEAAKNVGELRCWLERLARSQTYCQRRYDDFRRACRCRGALSNWWYSLLVLALQISRTHKFVDFSCGCLPLKFNSKFKFSLQVWVHRDFQSVSKVNLYPEVVLVDSQRDSDVRFGSLEVEMHVENKFDLEHWLRKTKVLIEVEFASAHFC